MQQANVQIYWTIKFDKFATKIIGDSSCKKREEQWVLTSHSKHKDWSMDFILGSLPQIAMIYLRDSSSHKHFHVYGNNLIQRAQKTTYSEIDKFHVPKNVTYGFRQFVIS